MAEKKAKIENFQLTNAVQEGPYYKAGSPARSALFQPGVPGERMTLGGKVFDAAGQPLAGAWLDFWQADGQGHYDNEGFTLRGHQTTDAEGHYQVETVLPGSYPGRTPHIHVKVRAKAKSPILTTQLFIPGLASNKTDFIYRDDLQMEIKNSRAGKTAVFDFRLAG